MSRKGVFENDFLFCCWINSTKLQLYLILTQVTKGNVVDNIVRIKIYRSLKLLFFHGIGEINVKLIFL